LVSALIRRLSPPKIDNGLQDIVENWQEPDANGPYQFEWPDDFSRDIVPKTCHSHNDYWRTAPLYEALAAGCVGVEADIWLMDDGELRVSHTWRSIREARTLRNMYLDPLENIFTNRNVSLASTEEKEVGVFDADPNMSVNLLIDFKNDGREIWPVGVEQLRPLYEKGWLTYFDGNEIVRGPLTIIGTGNTPFELVQEMQNRFIFFDAPLDDIANPAYTAENSYYASVKMYKAIGIMWFNKLSTAQIDTLKEQIKAASDKGLVSRYWGTPSWPISLRNKVWFTLSELGVGMLNVDDLVSATRWDWNWCVVAGLNLCGNR
jgi:glycerophosphoryl diester phosphodiesterase